MNYLYNGVEFPDINPVWTDKVTYPYVIIFAHTFTNTVTGLTETYYTLWFLDNAPYVIRNEGTSSSIAGGAIIQSYKLTGGNWEYYTTHEWPAAFTYKFDSVIYANFDLLDSDGTLYLAASEPVPVIKVTIPRKVDRYSYIVGFNLGLAGMAYPYSTPVPVAYLYNGVRLPDINVVWTDEMKTLYPYALLVSYSGGKGTLLYFSSNKFCVFTSYNQVTSYLGFGFEFNIEQTYYQAAHRPTSETYWNNSLVQRTTSDGTLGAVDTYPLLWSNHDIINVNDNSVFLAASDPIPVYE